MERCIIHLFGASGSGTSTLGRFIADRMDCFFMDTDDYYWQPTDPKYTTSRPIPERLELMQRDIAAHKRVVISGSLVDWGGRAYSAVYAGNSGGNANSGANCPTSGKGKGALWQSA